MGSWNGYHLTLGIKRRDPPAVAAELRREMERLVPEFTHERRARVEVEQSGDRTKPIRTANGAAPASKRCRSP